MAHELTVKIYYEDTDAGGVVYYANYLRYMERARTEFLAERGIDVYRLHEKGSLFVVAHVEANYRRPAVLGDVLTITTEVRELKHASLVLAHRVMRGDELLVDGAVTMVHVDAARRPQRLTQEFKERLGV